MGTPRRAAFMAAAASAQAPLADPTLPDEWDTPSALTEMTTGELAAHLARAALVVRPYLDGEQPGADALASPSAYFTLLNLTPDIDDALNRSVRDRARQGAGSGPAALLATYDAEVDTLRQRFDAEPPDRALRVAGDIPMRLDDYLVTRMLELVVHSDDLAASLGTPTPLFPDEVTDAVTTCLMSIARERHGDLAVIRAMARRERDTIEATRVL